MPAFNVNHTDLRRLPYRALEAAFSGMHNIRIMVPDKTPELQLAEILEFMNPDEIIAKYIGIGALKRDNAHLPRDEKRQIIRPEIPPSFRDVIRRIDDTGYRILRGTARNWERPFTSNSGDQLNRLDALSDVVKDAFVESFLREENRNFYDPNCDGRDRSIYANRIYRHLEALEGLLPVRI